MAERANKVYGAAKSTPYIPTEAREKTGRDLVDGIPREGTVVQTLTPQDQRTLHDTYNQAQKTPEQIEAQRQVYAPKEDTSTTGEKVVSGLQNLGSAIASGGEGSKAPEDIGTTLDKGPTANTATATETEKPDATVTTEQTTDTAAVTEPTEEEKAELQKQPAVQQAQAGVKSIMDAYADGSIDKNTRDYLIVDSIATFAKNLGKGVQNIGAAYTGGATQNADEQSQWAQQQQADLEQQQQMKRESVTGSPEWRKAQAEMASLKGAELTNKINEVKSKFTEPQLMNMLKIQAQQLGMGDIAQKIANRKLSISDVFSEMSGNAKSELGQLGYGLLSTLSLDGGQSLMNTGVNAFTNLF